MKLWLASIGLWQAVLLTAAFAQSKQPIDLLCSGTLNVGSGQFSAGVASIRQPSPYKFRLHVDLSEGFFCLDDCKSRAPLVTVQPEDIVFERSAGPEFRRFWLIRNEGIFFRTWWAPSGSKTQVRQNSVRGRCSPAPAKPTPVSAAKPLVKRSDALLPSILQATANSRQPGSERYLVEIAGHRPLSATQYTHLHALGYIYLDQDIWRISPKGLAMLKHQSKP